MLETMSLVMAGEEVILLLSRMLAELNGQLDMDRLSGARASSCVDGLAPGKLVCLSVTHVLVGACSRQWHGCSIVGSRGMPVEEAIDHGIEAFGANGRPEHPCARSIEIACQP